MACGWICGCIVLLICCTTNAAAATTKPTTRPADEVFATDRLWILHLRMTGDDWRAMQPAERGQSRLAGIFSPATRPATMPATRPAANAKAPPAEVKPPNRKSRGQEFAYICGSVDFDGKAYEDVGIRFKGNASYAGSARAMKRPFKLDFDRFVEGQKFCGLTQLNLNNNSFDASMLREALSYEVFRGAGIPSPRTSFALVYLTVEGVHNRECIGFYTLIEETGNTYLKQHFGTSKGLLLKPEGAAGLPYFGEEWAPYEAYGVKTDATAETKQRFVEFTRLVQKASNEEFREKIHSYLAVDEFLRFIAVNALLSNLDSFLTGGHNYLMYVNPGDQRVHFMPWDMHLSYGGWGPINTLEQQTNFSIDRPYLGRSPLIERVLAIEEYRTAYREHVKRIMATSFSPEYLHRRVDEMNAVIRKAEGIAKAEGKTTPKAGELGGLGSTMPDIKIFVAKRVECVSAQLEGKMKGYVPTWQDVAAARARKEANGLALPLAAAMFKALHPAKEGGLTEAELTAGIARFFVETDLSKRGSLDESTLAEALNDLTPQALGGRRGRNPQRRGIGIEWRWEGPGAFLARAIIREADKNKDKRVSLDELLAGAKQAFNEADDQKDGKLDQDELIVAISGLCRPREEQ
ncbi:MAG: CotH kinase family protein [Planctomycetota bacterium]|nr:CotH kinase family protein [Planctomycetota bacterium]